MTDTTLEEKPASLEKPASSNIESKDDEDVFLLEDRPLGTILYIQHNLAPLFFFYELFFGVWLGMHLPLVMIISMLVPPAVLYLFIHLVVYYLDFSRLRRAPISGPVLIYLLKEVESQSSRSSNLDWRQIAYSANEYAWETQGSDSIFFSGDHCRNYFEEYITGAVHDESYQVTLEHYGPNFGGKNSHRDLLDRSVRGYQSIAEVYQEV